MQKLILILVGAVAFAIGTNAQVGAIDLNRPDIEQDHKQENGAKHKHTCPMHPEVVTEQPGNCPKCGMNLVPMKGQANHPIPNADKSQAGAQRSTSNHSSNARHQSHQMHDASAMTMPH